MYLLWKKPSSQTSQWFIETCTLTSYITAGTVTFTFNSRWQNKTRIYINRRILLSALRSVLLWWPAMSSIHVKCRWTTPPPLFGSLSAHRPYTFHPSLWSFLLPYVQETVHHTTTYSQNLFSHTRRRCFYKTVDSATLLVFATVPDSRINSWESWFIFKMRKIKTNQYYESVSLNAGGNSTIHECMPLQDNIYI
jgi:hypothetical protein